MEAVQDKLKGKTLFWMHQQDVLPCRVLTCCGSHTSSQTQSWPWGQVIPSHMHRHMWELSVWNSVLSTQQRDWVLEENCKSQTQDGGTEETPPMAVSIVSCMMQRHTQTSNHHSRETLATKTLKPCKRLYKVFVPGSISDSSMEVLKNADWKIARDHATMMQDDNWWKCTSFSCYLLRGGKLD